MNTSRDSPLRETEYLVYSLSPEKTWLFKLVLTVAERHGFTSGQHWTRPVLGVLLQETMIAVELRAIAVSKISRGGRRKTAVQEKHKHSDGVIIYGVTIDGV